MRHAVPIAVVAIAALLIGVSCSGSDSRVPSQSTLWLFEVASVQTTVGSPVVHEIAIRVRRDIGSGPATPENGTVIRVLTSRGEFEDGTRDRCFLTVSGSILVTVHVPDTDSIELTMDGGSSSTTFVIGGTE